MVRRFPPYRRSEAAAWGSDYLQQLRGAAVAIAAHNRTAAQRAELPVCTDQALYQLLVVAKIQAGLLTAPPKGARLDEPLADAESAWQRIWYLYDQVPPTGITRRRA